MVRLIELFLLFAVALMVLGVVFAGLRNRRLTPKVEDRSDKPSPLAAIQARSARWDIDTAAAEATAAKPTEDELADLAARIASAKEHRE